MHRYRHRFGGVGTIVALASGGAFTAAHCLARVDGAPGVVVGDGDQRWRVLKRWSPRRTDLAVLERLDAPSGRRRAGGCPVPGWRRNCDTRVATAAIVRAGVYIEFVGHTGRRFQVRAATVLSVTPTSATALVEHRTGVCANDSGGPVFVAGVLVGIVTHRAGPPHSSLCSSHVIFTRLDAPDVRRRIRLLSGARQNIGAGAPV